MDERIEIGQVFQDLNDFCYDAHQDILFWHWEDGAVSIYCRMPGDVDGVPFDDDHRVFRGSALEARAWLLGFDCSEWLSRVNDGDIKRMTEPQEIAKEATYKLGYDAGYADGLKAASGANHVNGQP